MSKLTVIFGRLDKNQVAFDPGRDMDVQTLDFDDSPSVQSTANPYGDRDTYVEVTSTARCWISLGPNPTATVGGDSVQVPAGVPKTFKVRSSWKVAVIGEPA